MNGKQGDHPLTDILHWKLLVFSSKADSLITEIVNLGGEKQLEQNFDLLNPPPLKEFEAGLERIRDRMKAEAKDRGWEI